VELGTLQSKVKITDKTGEPLCSEIGLRDYPTLITESVKILDAHWQSSAITTATTTTVVEAIPNESIMLTDLVVILSKKVVASTIIVRFSDGTNTENLFTLDAASTSFQFSHAFQGGVRGWKEADLQVVTDGATTVSVVVGYIHISHKSTKTYLIWNANR